MPPSKVNCTYFASLVLKRKIIENLPPNIPLSLEVDVIPKILKDKKVLAYVSDENYREIGTPEKYEEFKKEFKEGLIDL